MSKKVFVKLEVKLEIDLKEEDVLDDIIQEMDYNFTYSPEGFGDRIVSSEILDFEEMNTK